MTLPFFHTNINIEEVSVIAKNFMDYYFSQNLICPIVLSGVIGAGKSTFVKACLHYLSVLHSGQVFTSPSFTIVNEYIMDDISIVQQYPHFYTRLSHQPMIYHIDLYRLKTPREADDIGIFDIIAHHICFIEWPENIHGNIPYPLYYIDISIESEIHRSIHIALLHS